MYKNHNSNLHNYCPLLLFVECRIISKLLDGINPFHHTTILKQTTLNVFCQNIENLHNWMDYLWQKVENIVAKGEIARSVQFLPLSLCFQEAVCCRGVRKASIWGKGLIELHTMIQHIERKCSEQEPLLYFS